MIFSAMPERGPQNIYDDPVFFEGYRKLRESDTGLNGALEVPAIRPLLPDLRGALVLDLGCGFGDFAQYASESGAECVTAVDISLKMLEAAKRRATDSRITYVHCAIEDYAPEPHSFDLVVSSMALHYVADLRSTLLRLFAALRPGGRLVFSVEHPVCTANPVGRKIDEQNQSNYWPLDRYRDEGERMTAWFVDNVVKYHRTVATYVNTLLDIGFVLRHLGEPMPSEHLLKDRPDLRPHSRRPPILVLACARP